jgi:glycosyltransferase involved in cell wall biosynthesis
MKILIVASYNKNRFAPFIVEQAEALKQVGCEVEYFGVVGKGIKGYLSAFTALRKKIKTYKPDVIHAHYGLSGLLANVQRTVPVVTTYHGSDINVSQVLRFSKIAMRLSQWNIFVSQRNVNIAKLKKKYILLPCGVNIPNYVEEDIYAVKQQLNWKPNKRYILFAGAFDNRVKNAKLAQDSVSLIEDAELIELKGYTREQVTALLYASDAFLMTSFTEGSPQVIKEAMACGCPIVSVDVGDVAEGIAGLEGCYIAERSPYDIAERLNKVFSFNSRTKGRERIIELGLTNDLVAKKLVEIYKQIKS